MNIQKEFEEQAIIDTYKLNKVVSSCKNDDQVRNAIRYYKLWYKKYKDFMFDSGDIMLKSRNEEVFDNFEFLGRSIKSNISIMYEIAKVKGICQKKNI